MWMKSHQKEPQKQGNIYSPFQRHVQMNIEVDKYANKKAVTSTHRRVKRPIYSSTKLGAYNKDGIFIGDIYSQLTLNQKYTPLWNYFQNTSGWKTV